MQRLFKKIAKNKKNTLVGRTLLKYIYFLGNNKTNIPNKKDASKFFEKKNAKNKRDVSQSSIVRLGEHNTWPTVG